MGKTLNVRVSEAEHDYCHQGGDASGYVRRLIQHDMMATMMGDVQTIIQQKLGKYAVGGERNGKAGKRAGRGPGSRQEGLAAPAGE